MYYIFVNILHARVLAVDLGINERRNMKQENKIQTDVAEKLEQTPVKAKRNYRDSIFRKLFNNKAAIIDLYNALSGSDYPPDTYVKIVTLGP